MNPIQYNGQEYKQVIKETLDEDNNQEINVLTYDKNNEIVSNNKITPFLKTETYFSEI